MARRTTPPSGTAAPPAAAAPRPRAPSASPARLEGEANAVALRVAFGTASPPSAASLAAAAREQAPGGAAAAGDGGVREQVGRALGYDFSGVRLDAGPDAARRAADDRAHAVTRGSRVDFAAGRFRPDRPLGRGLIAHELAHVAQLGAAPRRADADDRLHEAVHAGVDQEAALTPAPPGAPLKLDSCGGCGSCAGNKSDKKDVTGPSGDGDAGKDAAAASGPIVGGAPSPKNPNAIVRLSWTFDDGPTTATTDMESAMGNLPGTWFIMRNMLGTGAAEATALKSLADKQKKGGEIGIHAFHPTVAHHSWYPVEVAGAVPKAYGDMTTAMADLTAFVGLLRGAGVNPKFVRFPGGEVTETKKYLESEGVSATNSNAVARKILKGESVAGDGAGAVKVAADFQTILTTLSALGLVLWGGSSSGALLTSNSWEAESAPAGSPLNNDALPRFKKVVDAAAKEGKPRSLIILAHDTAIANAAAVKTTVADMDAYAVSKDVRIEYYTMSALFQAVRGVAP